MYWIGLTVLLVLWAVGLTSQFIWYRGIDSELVTLGSTLAQQPGQFGDLRVGGRDMFLFQKDLTINMGILGFVMQVSVVAATGVILLLAATVATMRRRQDRAQPATPPYSEPATRSPQG